MDQIFQLFLVRRPSDNRGLFFMPEKENAMEKICGNCAHWMGHQQLRLINAPFLTPAGEIIFLRAAGCACFAVTEEDAGECAVLMTERGTCRLLTDRFEPTPEYLLELEDVRAEQAAMEATEESLPGLELNRMPNYAARGW